MTDDHFTADPFAANPAKPVWLMTLADLALLLVGFLVLIQATANHDAVARSLRERFGTEAPAPVPVAATAAVFAPGLATLANPAPLVAWTRDALADNRVTVTVTGSVAAQEPGGVLLATDRARAVLAALIAAGLPADRLILSTTHAAGARATLTLAFSGDPRSIP